MMFSLDGESHFLPVIVNFSIDFFHDKRLKKKCQNRDIFQ